MRREVMTMMLKVGEGFVVVASVDVISRGNLGMVLGMCLHQALRTGLSLPFGLTSPSPGAGLW